MRWRPERRSARPRQGSSASKTIALGSNDGSDHSLEISFSQLHHRPIGPGELASLRAMWWSQVGAGHHMPAEIDVIVIEGGAA